MTRMLFFNMPFAFRKYVNLEKQFITQHKCALHTLLTGCYCGQNFINDSLLQSVFFKFNYHHSNSLKGILQIKLKSVTCLNT